MPADTNRMENKHYKESTAIAGESSKTAKISKAAKTQKSAKSAKSTRYAGTPKTTKSARNLNQPEQPIAARSYTSARNLISQKPKSARTTNSSLAIYICQNT
jgi:hypothetical protein